MNVPALGTWPRRRVAATAGFLILTALGGRGARAAKQKQRKNRKGKRNRRDGSVACRGCLGRSFSITAAWTGDRGYLPILFVPPGNAATGPSPFVSCVQDASRYPFVHFDYGPLDGPGESAVTIVRRLAGAYEYWMTIRSTPAGAVQVALRDAQGDVVRVWENPVVPAGPVQSWHVFDVDSAGQVISVEALVAGDLPDAAHTPNTGICPAG